MKELVKIDSIEKYYGNKGKLTKAIDDISFTIHEGEFIGIMGPSGSGKSTLLNCISTVDKVTGGHIFVNGNDIVSLKKNQLASFRSNEIGYIFQDFNLLDTLNGFENIALALTIKKVDPSLIESKVNDIANYLEIGDVLQKFPYEMSGGQQQRVACARALIGDPSIVLADEPTGALDSKSSRKLLESMERLNEEKLATILMVTHDTFSASFAKRILFIKDGRIFSELIKGSDTRKQFFDRIIDVVTLLGGDSADVL